ncbi:hypothetical protein [Streptomyces sp. NPDC057939]|uniref:hypothetical protein n=1 Tax=Streptomyces sp. NPDC057939 TaxID=3346284 RepID=UPI0036EEE612
MTRPLVWSRLARDHTGGVATEGAHASGRVRTTAWGVDELASSIAELAFEVLEFPVAVTTDLADVGLEPSGAIRLAAHAYQEFGLPLSVAGVYAGRTPIGIAAALLGRGTSPITGRIDLAGGPGVPSTAWDDGAPGGAGRPTEGVSLLYTATGDSEISPARLTSALRGLAARQAVLRTRPIGAGSPARPPGGLPDWGLLDVDLVPVPDTGWEALQEALDLAARAAREEFDTERGPLARCTLYTWGGGRLLAVHLHRGVLDPWSLDAFERELERGYAAAHPGDVVDADGTGPRPEDARGPAAGPSYGLPMASDRQVRPAAPPPIAWPARARPHDPDGRDDAAVESVLPVDEALLTRLRSAARDLGVSLTSLVFTAYARGLAEFTGRPEFLVGLTVSGRVEPWQETALGRRELTLRVRVRAVPGEPLVTLLRRCDRQVLLSADHGWWSGTTDSPGSRPDIGGAPPVQASLCVEPGTPARPLRLGPALLAPARMLRSAPAVDLTAELLRADRPYGGRRLLFTADPSRIDARGLGQLAGAVGEALERLASDPDAGATR